MSDVTAVIASPRKNGNCAAIVGKMVETLEAEGKKVDVFYLNQLENVLNSIAESGSVILATPDYFGQAVSQYRMLEDRFYGYVGAGPNGFVCNIPEGKKVVTVVTSGSGAGAENIAATIKNVLGGFLKCDVVGNIDYREGPNGPAKDNAAVMEEAVALAKKL